MSQSVDARLAKLAGWSEARDSHEEMEAWWWQDAQGNPRSEPPAYSQSTDLLRREILPLLTDAQWEALNTRLEYQWESVLASVPHPEISWAQYILTLDHAVLAAACAEVLDGA